MSFPLQTEASDHRPDPILLTIAEVAAELRMSQKSVRRRIKHGVIRKAPTGGRLVRISSEELRRLGATAPFEPTRTDEVSTP
jgi:excisionase family DNA binding protein